MGEIETIVGAVVTVAALTAFTLSVVALIGATASPGCGCQRDCGDVEDGAAALAFIDEELRGLRDEIDDDLADTRVYDDATYRTLLRSYRGQVDNMIGDDESEVL